jgi:hypothetical protein
VSAYLLTSICTEYNVGPGAAWGPGSMDSASQQGSICSLPNDVLVCGPPVTSEFAERLPSLPAALAFPMAANRACRAAAASTWTMKLHQRAGSRSAACPLAMPGTSPDFPPQNSRSIPAPPLVNMTATRNHRDVEAAHHHLQSPTHHDDCIALTGPPARSRCSSGPQRTRGSARPTSRTSADPASTFPSSLRLLRAKTCGVRWRHHS